MKTLSVSEAPALVSDEYSWIDVRSPAEFRAEHMPQSVNVPLDAIQAGKHEGFGEKPLVVSCLSGKRSEAAAKILSEKLDVPVHSLAGGIEAWKAAGHDTVKGSGAISIERQVRIAAGAMVAIFSVLGLTVHACFFGVPIFIGCGLVFAGVTDTCGMGLMLAKMPWNR